jgi:hypothetical protein
MSAEDEREAAYSVAENSQRSAMMFFDMKDASEIPGIAEPLFAGLNAKIHEIIILSGGQVDSLNLSRCC